MKRLAALPCCRLLLVFAGFYSLPQRSVRADEYGWKTIFERNRAWTVGT